ncbi:MAG: chemotaxis protein CheW [Deltaproteobacteria bacterium]|nr:chemotaxis protein CheW [Deltaproteobacteria bacterium]
MNEKAEEKIGKMSSERHFATFFLDGHLFGVEVSEVLEVIHSQEVTPVPLAPPMVKGLINLRGRITTAFDLRRRLDLQEPEIHQQPMNMVIKTGDEAVSLLVDKIGDVLKVEETAFAPPPENLQGVTREFIQGVYKLDNRLLLILNLDRTLSIAG